MRTLQILFCVFTCVFIRCSGLNCRTSGGPSIEELKSVYRTCLKHQDNRSSSSSEETTKRRTQDSQGSQGHYNNNDDWSSLGDFAGHSGGMGGGDWSDGSRSDRTRNNDRSTNWNTDMTTRNSDPMSRNGYNMHRNSDQMSGMNGGDYMTRNGYVGEQYGTQDLPRYNYPQVAPPSRRYRRDKTSGHRSQYNPNTSWKTSTARDDNYREDQSGSSENSMNRSESKKACALHCFMQEFEMIGDNDMPDKYLVVQGLTKYANNEDLKEFLQEAVEECFQIVQHENKRDKCEFSKNLGLCLSEKGRANCEDWKEELKLY